MESKKLFHLTEEWVIQTRLLRSTVEKLDLWLSLAVYHGYDELNYAYCWKIYGLINHNIKYKEKIWSLYKKDQHLFSTANPADFGPFIKTYKLLLN